MSAAAYLIAHPDIRHGRVRIAFTPDEEVGRGTKYFDVARFGARCAYTMDGGSRGEVETESFSADAMTATFHGFNTHPGYAKGRMVNAIRIAADFRASPAARSTVARNHRGRRGVRASLRRERRRRTDVGQAADSRFPHGGPEGKGNAGRTSRAPGGCRLPGGARGHRDRGVVSQHERDAGPASAGGRVRVRSRTAGRPRSALETDPRRYRRLASVVHGPADAQPLRGRAQLPLAAGMGVGAGHGKGGRSDRESVHGLGRALRRGNRL